jgi:metal-responsive CopG/Arc/MetJ family transcriptional regulator
MFSKSTVRLDKALLERARAAAEKAGYSSTEEFIQHAIEKELARLEEATAKDQVVQQLKGLGYLE